MKLRRLARHVVTTRWSTRRRFSSRIRHAIERAIRQCEARHGGEIRFVVETAFDFPELWHDLPPRRRAWQLFGQLGVWNTEHNNGVLIYVLMADRVVEIVADRGIAGRIEEAEWRAVCERMEQHYRAGRFRDGSISGIEGVGALIERHFPGAAAGANELPNRPVLL
ncbi:MAG: TPM domain-containing protein [Gammaproteobacteria bacterium]|nr:TPM domain-containing protein [Gammaproteobacteria bacterium]